MKIEHLVHMANQIADFFAAYPMRRPSPGTADHIKKFWDPRMRKGLIEHAKGRGAGLRDFVMAAIPKLDPHREASAAPDARQPPGPPLPR
jgi:formate dehydrogenase subunit delta